MASLLSVDPCSSGRHDADPGPVQAADSLKASTPDTPVESAVLLPRLRSGRPDHSEHPGDIASDRCRKSDMHYVEACVRAQEKDGMDGAGLRMGRTSDEAVVWDVA